MSKFQEKTLNWNFMGESTFLCLLNQTYQLTNTQPINIFLKEIWITHGICILNNKKKFSESQRLEQVTHTEAARIFI